MQAYYKFKDRSVAFVSLTNMPEAAAAAFVDQAGVPWPCGYGMTMPTIAMFGALNRDRMIPGYELRPTLYLIGPDGRILWSDRHARTRHEAPAPLLKELEDEIERLLVQNKK